MAGKIVLYAKLMITILLGHEICSHLPIPKNAATHPTSFSNNVGETIQFSCDDGYQLYGSANISCLDNGKWSDDPPVCAGINLEAALCLLRINLFHYGQLFPAHTF